MFSIEADNDVLQALVLRFKKAEANIGRHLLEAATDGMVAVVDRIQQRGQNSRGETMRTKSPRAIGVYSRAYAFYQRRKKGRQTSKIDFTMEGDLVRNYNVIKANSEVVEVGFMDRDMADIARYLEAYFGRAFFLSEREKEFVLNKLQTKTKADLQL
jgi:hypothetical protein